MLGGGGERKKEKVLIFSTKDKTRPLLLQELGYNWRYTIEIVASDKS